MKIKLDRTDGATFGSDVIALARLFSLLRTPNDSKLQNDEIINMWREYLLGIEKHWIEANYNNIPEKYEFDLPFEEDYKKIIVKEKK